MRLEVVFKNGWKLSCLFPTYCEAESFGVVITEYFYAQVAELNFYEVSRDS